MYKKPLLIFLFGSVILALLFFLVPINLFDGEVHYNNGLKNWSADLKLALSYFVGIGIKEGDLQDVVGFNLKPSGYALAVIFIIGFPALFAYRSYLKNTKK